MSHVNVNGVNLYYELNGSGPPVVQIGGAVNGHEGYALITPSMQEHFTVIDYDHRGYGFSDRPRQKYTMDVWADDLAGLLDARGDPGLGAVPVARLRSRCALRAGRGGGREGDRVPEALSRQSGAGRHVTSPAGRELWEAVRFAPASGAS